MPKKKSTATTGAAESPPNGHVPPDVLSLRLVLVGCSIATIEKDPVAFDADGRPVLFHVVPRAYHFQAPCPFNKSAPDQTCRFCSLHTEIHAIQRSVTEPEAEVMQQSLPGAWTSVTLQAQRVAQ